MNRLSILEKMQIVLQNTLNLEMLDAFSESLKSRWCCDVVLHCGKSSRVIVAHKLVLGLTSGFLCNILKEVVNDEGPTTVLLPDVDYEDMTLLIMLIYKGSVVCGNSRCNSILKLGKLFGIHSVDTVLQNDFELDNEESSENVEVVVSEMLDELTEQVVADVDSEQELYSFPDVECVLEEEGISDIVTSDHLYCKFDHDSESTSVDVLCKIPVASRVLPVKPPKTAFIGVKSKRKANSSKLHPPKAPAKRVLRPICPKPVANASVHPNSAGFVTASGVLNPKSDLKIPSKSITSGNPVHKAVASSVQGLESFSGRVLDQAAVVKLTGSQDKVAIVFDKREMPMKLSMLSLRTPNKKVNLKFENTKVKEAEAVKTVELSKLQKSATPNTVPESTKLQKSATPNTVPESTKLQNSATPNVVPKLNITEILLGNKSIQSKHFQLLTKAETKGRSVTTIKSTKLQKSSAHKAASKQSVPRALSTNQENNSVESEHSQILTEAGTNIVCVENELMPQSKNKAKTVRENVESSPKLKGTKYIKKSKKKATHDSRACCSAHDPIKLGYGDVFNQEAQNEDNPVEPNISNDPGKFPDDPLTCDICGIRCTTVEFLQSHKSRHTKTVGKHRCPFCPYRNRRINVTRHMEQHLGIHKGIKCDTCGKTFLHAGNLKRHSLIHTGEKPFICLICSMGFNQKQSLDAHTRSHHSGGLKKFACKHCPKTFNVLNLLVDHELIHGPEPLCFVCAVCGVSFVSKLRLNYHEKRCGGGDRRKRPSVKKKRTAAKKRDATKTHICNVCGKAFQWNFILKDHMNTHTKEETFQCNVCDKTFYTYKQLFLHSRYHVEKRFSCLHCGKRFAIEKHLTDHERIHTDERPFVCTDCPASFKSDSNLRSHVVALHTKKFNCVCTNCNKGFHRVRDLDEHAVTCTASYVDL